MIRVADRVKETTTTTGTGTLDLAGSETGFRTFVAGIGDTYECYYLIDGGAEWEVGIGTVTDAGTDTLSRDTVLSSSNGDALVNLSSGGTVSCTNPSVNVRQIRRNLLINPEGRVDQRGSYGSSVNDGVFICDRWILCSEANDDVTPSQETSDLPTGGRSAIKLTWNNANAQVALVQIVESSECNDAISALASARISVKSANFAKVRLAILSWQGTADACTADVVGTWAGGGTEPTWATNWTREGSITDITSPTSWTEDVIDGASIDTGSTKQIALVLWLDDTDASASDTLYLTNAKLEPGPNSTDFEYRTMSEEAGLCFTYCYSINVGNLAVVSAYQMFSIMISAVSSTQFTAFYSMPAIMRDTIIDLTVSGSQLLVRYNRDFEADTLAWPATIDRVGNNGWCTASGVGLSEGLYHHVGNNDTNAYMIFETEVTA